MRVLTALLLLVFTFSFSQENQMDSSGKRHGLWKGYHEKTKKLRYEGNFDHGKELGVFKYYADNKENTLMATRDFSQGDGSCYTVFYDTKKFKVSEGNLVNKKPEGLWKYYHFESDKIMNLENYKNGKLNGEKNVYYKNGQIAEKSYYKAGSLDGKYVKYAENGNLIEESNYVNGNLNGKVAYYDGEGNVLVKGEYKNNKKSGTWETYENGKLVKKESAKKFSGKNFKMDNPKEVENKEKK